MTVKTKPVNQSAPSAVAVPETVASVPFVDREKSVLGRALKKGFSFPASDEWRGLLSGGMSTAAGVKVGPSTAMAASAVYASTSLIAETIAAMPIRIVERGDETRTPVQPEEARVLWDRPNPMQHVPDFIATIVLSRLLWGNAYGWPRRLNNGNTFELWPIDPDRVTEAEAVELARSQVGVRFRIEGVDPPEVENRPGEPVKLMHVPHITMPGRIKGVSPIEQNAELIGMTLSSQEHAARFLGEGVHMGGVIESEADSDPAEAQRLWEGFQKMHAGPKKAGRVGVIMGGAKFKPITIPPNELQFLEQMKYSDQRIAGLYRVPPHMIADVERSTSWGTGIEEQTIQFVQHTLLPIIRGLENALEHTLFRDKQYSVRFVTSGLLRGSTPDRAAFYRVLQSLGALNADEIRAFEDMPPLPDGKGQIYWMPLNIAPIEAVRSGETEARSLSTEERVELLEQQQREGRL